MEKIPQEKKLNSIENIKNDEFMVIKEDFKNDKERSSRKEAKIQLKRKLMMNPT